MNKLIILFVALFTIVLGSCNDEKNERESQTSYQCPMQCEGEKIYSDTGACPVCTMQLKKIDSVSTVKNTREEILPESIFNLSSKWVTQNNKTIEIKDLKGDVLVIVMIYTSCQAACPRLVADMRSLEQKVKNSAVKYVLISIDPVNDTPERLKAFAIENKMDTDQWIFLQGKEDDVREFSNVLAVKYKQISPIDFSHSNIISVYDQAGVLCYQQEGLNVNNEITVSKIKKLLE